MTRVKTPFRILVILFIIFFLLSTVVWQHSALTKARRESEDLRTAIRDAQPALPAQASKPGDEHPETLSQIMRLRGAVAQLTRENSYLVAELNSCKTSAPAAAPTIEPQTIGADSALSPVENEESWRDVRDRREERKFMIIGQLRQKNYEIWAQFRNQGEVVQNLVSSLGVPDDIRNLAPETVLNRNDLEKYKPYSEARLLELALMAELDLLEQEVASAKRE